MTTPADALELKADQITVRDLAIMQFSCRYTGNILHKKNTVVTTTWYNGKDKDATIDVMHVEAWDKVKVRFAAICRKRNIEYKVLDGRELF